MSISTNNHKTNLYSTLASSSSLNHELNTLKDEYGLYINGEFVTSHNRNAQLLEIENPATQEILSKVHIADKIDVERAIDSSTNSFNSGTWSKMDVRDRSSILMAGAAKLRTRVADIAYIESLQTGRPLREMNAQLGRLPEWLEYYASLIRTAEGQCPPFKGSYLNYVRRVPLGSCALITPWNHPMLIAIKKIAPALAAGNSIIVKPSELAPCSVLEFAQLMSEVGLPDGVLNVISGYGHTCGKYLCESPRLNKIDITGGTETGKLIGEIAGRNLAYYTAELGGKTPMIVFDDIGQDISQCVNGLTFGSFIATGQTCIMGARLLIQDTIYEQVVEQLTAKIKRDIRWGDSQQLDVNFGPVINHSQREKMLQFMQLAEDEGANVLCGGRIPSKKDYPTYEWNEKGYYFEPTLIGDCTPDMQIVQQEIFGPIVVAMKFKTEAEAIEMANNSQFGLAAAIWTPNISRAYRVSDALDVGIVWINDHHRNDPSSVWGGMKQSGLGRENGVEAYHEYTQTKSVVINCSEQPFDWFAPNSNSRYG